MRNNHLQHNPTIMFYIYLFFNLFLHVFTKTLWVVYFREHKTYIYSLLHLNVDSILFIKKILTRTLGKTKKSTKTSFPFYSFLFLMPTKTLVTSITHVMNYLLFTGNLITKSYIIPVD